MCFNPLRLHGYEKLQRMLHSLTSSRRRLYIHTKVLPIINRTFKHAFRFLCVCGRETCQHATCGMPLLRLTCTHAIVFRSPWGHGLVTPGKRHCKQWTSSLFLLIFASSLYPRPVPLTYQPRICKDGFISIVTRPFISVRYAVCSTGHWSIIGRCVRACQQSSAIETRPQ